MVHGLKHTVLRVGNFLVQYHFYLVAYISSSFLAQFVGVENVGYIFILSSLIVGAVLFSAPTIFRMYGTRNVLTVFGVFEIALLIALAGVSGWLTAVILFTLQAIVLSMLFIGVDLLIEAETKKESVTGSLRTSYLTITNFAVLLGALSISFIVVGDQYWRAFVSAAIVMLPFLVLSIAFLPRVSFAESAPHSMGATVFRELKKKRSLRNIVFAHLLLQIFFAWMGIYAPILLFAYEGFAWSQIGIILAIAMLPYVLFEYPLGVIADRWLGEKEILIAGFVIIVLSLFGMYLLIGASFWWWVGVMVFSRIGGAAVESMTEVHFFRQVNEKNTDTITFFRSLRQVGSIIGPAVASIALIWLTLPTIFAVFGAVMILGIPVALSIVDTK